MERLISAALLLLCPASAFFPALGPPELRYLPDCVQDFAVDGQARCALTLDAALAMTTSAELEARLGESCASAGLLPDDCTTLRSYARKCEHETRSVLFTGRAAP